MRRFYESIIIVYIWQWERHSWTEFCAYARVRFLIFQASVVIAFGMMGAVMGGPGVYVGPGRQGASAVHSIESIHAHCGMLSIKDSVVYG